MSSDLAERLEKWAGERPRLHGTVADERWHDLRKASAHIRALEAELAATEYKLVGAYEEAAKVCEDQQKVFASEEYATGQPFSSFGERFACGACAQAIRSLGETT